MRVRHQPRRVSVLLVTVALTAGLIGFGLEGASGAPPVPPAFPSASPTAAPAFRWPSPPATSLMGGNPRAAAAVPSLAWQPCAPGQPFDCAAARVPLNYRRPGGRAIELALIRHPATDQANRIGSLFFNPGGPGGSGTSALPGAIGYFSEQVRARFDVVSWDPRGIGESTAVQCFPSAGAEDAFLSRFASIPVGRAQEQKLINSNAKRGRKCARRNGSLLRHVSTADSARDLSLLRAAVGDRKLNYYGVSYGTFLGATYANLFPKRTRAIVLDGAINPDAWVTRQPRGDGKFLGTSLRQKTDEGSGKTLNKFLGLCGGAGTGRCAFSAGGAAATRSKFATLVRQMRRHPLRERGGYTYAELIDKTVASLYYSIGWAALAQGLQDVWTNIAAPSAPPAPNQQRYAGPEQAFAVICGESPNPNPSAFPALAAFATQRSGALGPHWSWNTEACGSWQATAAQKYTGPWNRRTASRILVIGNTHDPATPHQGAVAMARQLARARLLTVRGYGHTELYNPSTCAVGHVNRYFIDGALPPEGTKCKQDLSLPFTG